jgi:hypothetical protein
MKLTNFKISHDLIAIETDEKYLDLHNCYDFKSHNFNQKNRCLKLQWVVNKGEWVPANYPQNLFLIFEGVTYFECREDENPTPEEQDTLDELGFFQNETLGKVEYNGEESPQKGSELLLLRFLGGVEIAVIAKQAECVLKEICITT